MGEFAKWQSVGKENCPLTLNIRIAETLKCGSDAQPIYYEKILIKLLPRALTYQQMAVLDELSSIQNPTTVSRFIEYLSKKHQIPSSTLRWNIRQLRELELIKCGTSITKGIPMETTNSGKIVYAMLKQIKEG